MRQAQVYDTSVPAIEGDFSAANSTRATYPAGPGGLQSWGWSQAAFGPNGAGTRIGRFAWLWPDAVAGGDDLGFTEQGKRVVNGAIPGSYDPQDVNTYPQPDGFVSRAGLLAGAQAYLDENALYIRVGNPMELFTAGDFWCVNSGARAAAVGDAVAVSLQDGSVQFAPRGGSTPLDHVQSNWTAQSAGGTSELVKISFDGFVAP